MENYNLLKFKTFRVNDKSIYIPMENIIQQYDDEKFAEIALSCDCANC